MKKAQLVSLKFLLISIQFFYSNLKKLTVMKGIHFDPKTKMDLKSRNPFGKKSLQDIDIKTSNSFHNDKPPNKLMAPIFFKPPSAIQLPFAIENRIPTSWVERVDFEEPCVSEDNLKALIQQLCKDRREQLEEEYRNQKAAFCSNYIAAKSVNRT